MNPYNVLGVPRGADDETIRKRYRELAMQWHPDKNQYCIEEAEARFASINQAYQILKDPETRRQYDGRTPLPSRPSSLRRPVRPPGAPSPSRFGSSFDELYNNIYGSNGVSRSTSQCNLSDDKSRSDFIASSYGAPIQRSQSHSTSTAFPQPTGTVTTSESLDVRVIVNCTLEEMFNCESKMIKIERKRETGQVEVKSLKLTLTQGIPNKHVITVPKQGHRESGKIPGDLIFTIIQTPHDRFTRVGDDIIERITITLKDAISCDFEIRCTGIDNEVIEHKCSEIIQPETEIRIKGRGMKREDGTRGDHIFKIGVLIPIFTDEQRAKILQVMAD